MISWAFVRVSSRDFCLCYRGVFFVIVRYHDFLLGVGFLLGFKWRGLGDIWRHTIGGQSVFIPTKTKRHFKKFRKKQKGGYSRLEFRVVFYLYILGHFGQQFGHTVGRSPVEKHYISFLRKLLDTRYSL